MYPAESCMSVVLATHNATVAAACLHTISKHSCQEQRTARKEGAPVKESNGRSMKGASLRWRTPVWRVAKRARDTQQMPG